MKSSNSESLHPVDIHVGNQLKIRRKMLGFSRSELANKMNINVEQLKKYEDGIEHIPTSILYEFAPILDMSLSVFYDGLDNADIIITDSDRALKLAHDIEKLSEPIKSAILVIIKETKKARR